MTSGENEHSPSSQSPEEATTQLLVGLAENPTNENFAEVQVLLEEKLDAAQTDINAFRSIVTYLSEMRSESAMRRISKRDYGDRIKSPYDYIIEYEVKDFPKVESVGDRISRFILRKVPVKPEIKTATRTTSIFGDYSPLKITLPENWNDLATRYMEFPPHYIMQIGYDSPLADAPEEVAENKHTDEWQILRQAKIELAKRQRAQDSGGSSDSNHWGYHGAILEQVAIVDSLNKKMGLEYESGYLIHDQESK